MDFPLDLLLFRTGDQLYLTTNQWIQFYSCGCGSHSHKKHPLFLS